MPRGAVDLGHVPADPVIATDDEEEEQAEDDAEDQPEPQRRPVAVAGLGIEVVFVALAVAVALVVVMVRQRVFHWRKTSLRGCARIRAHTGYHFCIREACFSVAYGDGGFGLASDLSSH